MRHLMSIWGDCSVAVMDSVLCFLHVIDTKQLLMYCWEVQQFTGSKKCHYCTLSHEIEQQCEGNGLNSCSSNAGATFAQQACHTPFCDHFVECQFMDLMEYKKGALTEQILESTAVPSVHKVSKQLAQLGTVTNTITTTASEWQCYCHHWSSCCQDQESEKTTTNTGNEESLEGLFSAF